jgi:hypothetical protein
MQNNNNIIQNEINNNSSDSSLIINEQNNMSYNNDNNNNNDNDNNKKENDDNVDSEGSPILPQLETMKVSLEEYYRNNYPEHKIIKINNITFVKMGKLLTFHFDKNNNYIPKYSIGPHWYLTVLLIIIVLVLSIVLNSTIFRFSNIFKKIIFFIFVIVIYYFIFKTALTHPQVVMNKIRRNAEESGFCYICQVHFDPRNKVEHCRFCGVCIEKMDHHCVWVGKCVAKNNTFYFYAMIVSVIIMYIYIIIIGIFMAVG